METITIDGVKLKRIASEHQIEPQRDPCHHKRLKINHYIIGQYRFTESVRLPGHLGIVPTFLEGPAGHIVCTSSLKEAVGFMKDDIRRLL